MSIFADFGTINFLGGKWLLPVITAAAVADSINPCAISVLLITIAFLLSLSKNRSQILKTGGLYIFAIFLTYTLIGLGALKVMSFFGVPQFMTKFGAAIIIVFGAISLIEHFYPAFPIKLKIPESIKPSIAQLMKKGSAPAIFAMGVLVGLFEFPCTGGPYIFVLSLLHDKTTYLKGFAYLVFYNFIFVLPLIIILLIASNGKLLGKIKEWKKKEGSIINVWGSIVMIGLGIIIFLL